MDPLQFLPPVLRTPTRTNLLRWDEKARFKISFGGAMTWREKRYVVKKAGRDKVIQNWSMTIALSDYQIYFNFSSSLFSTKQTLFFLCHHSLFYTFQKRKWGGRYVPERYKTESNKKPKSSAKFCHLMLIFGTKWSTNIGNDLRTAKMYSPKYFYLK